MTDWKMCDGCNNYGCRHRHGVEGAVEYYACAEMRAEAEAKLAAAEKNHEHEKKVNEVQARINHDREETACEYSHRIAELVSMLDVAEANGRKADATIFSLQAELATLKGPVERQLLALITDLDARLATAKEDVGKARIEWQKRDQRISELEAKLAAANPCEKCVDISEGDCESCLIRANKYIAKLEAYNCKQCPFSPICPIKPSGDEKGGVHSAGSEIPSAAKVSDSNGVKLSDQGTTPALETPEDSHEPNCGRCEHFNRPTDDFFNSFRQVLFIVEKMRPPKERYDPISPPDPLEASK